MRAVLHCQLRCEGLQKRVLPGDLTGCRPVAHQNLRKTGRAAFFVFFPTCQSFSAASLLVVGSSFSKGTACAGEGKPSVPKAKDERGVFKILYEECLKSPYVWLFAVSYFWVRACHALHYRSGVMML